jgi:prepilin signal peptidase PulO-like enzyme (type II secretory pathway)
MPQLRRKNLGALSGGRAFNGAALRFGLLANRFQSLSTRLLVFVTTMVSLIFIDAEHMILPNVITYPLLIFALLIRLVFPLVISAEYFTDLNFAPLRYMSDYPIWLVSLAGRVLGGLVGGGFLWLVGAIWKLLRGVDAMGLGDVKMMFAVGALLGWRLTLLSIFLGAFSGALSAFSLFTVKRKRIFKRKFRSAFFSASVRFFPYYSASI